MGCWHLYCWLVLSCREFWFKSSHFSLMGLAMSAKKILAIALLTVVVTAMPGALWAQDKMPEDNGIFTYYTPPRARPSEEHPLRILAYVVHPVGWVVRELITRPFSYFASSTETTRSVFGYREPYDYRNPECFSADSSVPDCRAISPYNYDSLGTAEAAPDTAALNTTVERQVYFPDVNFDFDVRKLNDLGKGRTRQIAKLLEQSPGVNVVLEGHTDYKGSDPYNEKLGMDRSEAVRQELVALGVPADRVATVTFGKTKPVFGEQEDWARAVNRRVEIHLDSGQTSEAPKAEAAPEPAE